VKHIDIDWTCKQRLVNETNLVQYLFLVYFVNFIYNLYMFRNSPGPSSGGTTVFMRHLVLVILYSWLSGVQDASVLHTRQKRRWFHLQDYIEMHGQQNMNCTQ